MLVYSLRRLLLIIPTLVCILLANFAIVQAAPGGPVEQAIARMQGLDSSQGIGGGAAETLETPAGATAGRGLDPRLIADIERQYGFDKPPLERLWLMITQYARLDFGKSFFLGAQVTDMIADKMPVTLSLGLWALVITYGVSIPLGIRKAVKHGSAFDVWTSTAIIIGYALPAFLFALLLILVFGGGSGLNWFPIRGLVSENFASLSPAAKLLDYARHLVLPVSALVVGGFATLTLLTKNSFLDEMARQYVITARAKGANERQVLYGHVMRNAMLTVVAGLPHAMVHVFFGGSLLIEVLFSLDGMGRMSYDAAVSRDYPVVFGSLFIFTLAGLLIKLLGDLCYRLIDPRIDFSSRAH